MVAFVQLMNTKLRPALVGNMMIYQLPDNVSHWVLCLVLLFQLHTYWLEGGNLDYGVRGSYASAVPFPGNMLYVRSLSKKAYNSVYTAQGGDLEYSGRHDSIDRKVNIVLGDCLTIYV